MIKQARTIAITQLVTEVDTDTRDGHDTQSTFDLKTGVVGSKDFITLSELNYEKSGCFSFLHTSTAGMAMCIRKLSTEHNEDEEALIDDVVNLLKARLKNKTSFTKKAPGV